MAEPKSTRGRDLNHVAWLYDPLVERMSFGREARFRQHTLEIMELNPESRVLDIGCGTGSLTLLIDGQLGGGGAVVGVDAAPRMIAIAEAKARRRGSRAAFAAGIAEELDFPAASFDLVVNSMFCHHIDHDLKILAFAEMFRVLRPGGQLVTVDIDSPDSLVAKGICRLSRYLLLQPELEDNLRGRLPGLMEAAGFRELALRRRLYHMVSFFTARKPEAAGC